MKKLIPIFLILLFIPVNTFAIYGPGGPGQDKWPTSCIPTIAGTGHTTDRHMFRWKIVCTGGNLIYEEELLSLMPANLRREVMRSVWMIMDVTSTGTWADYTIVFKNAQQQIVFLEVLPADETVTGIDLSSDWNQYLPAHEFVYLTVGANIWYGTITIYIEGWIPEGR